jgi:hypothetical protein
VLRGAGAADVEFVVSQSVMAGLDPAIHVLLSKKEKDVDARDERGHDDG